MNTRKLITIEAETKATIAELKRHFILETYTVRGNIICPQQVQVNVMKQKKDKKHGKAKD